MSCSSSYPAVGKPGRAPTALTDYRRTRYADTARRRTLLQRLADFVAS